MEKKHLGELLEEELGKINSVHRSALNKAETHKYILDVADNNPRQLKRLINSFIVTYDTYKGDKPLDGSILFRCLSIQKGNPKIFLECIKNEDFRKHMIDFIGEMIKIHRIIHNHSLESESEAITTSRVPTLNLVMKIDAARGNEIKDGDARDNEIKDGDELRRKIRIAFRNFLQDKYKPESNKTEDSEDSNLQKPPSEWMKVREEFWRVVESDELIKMDISKWFSLMWALDRISGDDKDLNKYTDAINMMREDLKIDTDSRNLNKN